VEENGLLVLRKKMRLFFKVTHFQIKKLLSSSKKAVFKSVMTAFI